MRNAWHADENALVIIITYGIRCVLSEVGKARIEKWITWLCLLWRDIR